MSKSKCYFCRQRLKGGEWMLKALENGEIVKCCRDARKCEGKAKDRIALRACESLVERRKARDMIVDMGEA